jgi:hypothetical protein
MAKIGVSAVKVKILNFILFIFNWLKIVTALKSQSVTSQEEGKRYLHPGKTYLTNGWVPEKPLPSICFPDL